jgi:hypothetical protein
VYYRPQVCKFEELQQLVAILAIIKTTMLKCTSVVMVVVNFPSCLNMYLIIMCTSSVDIQQKRFVSVSDFQPECRCAAVCVHV